MMSGARNRHGSPRNTLPVPIDHTQILDQALDDSRRHTNPKNYLREVDRRIRETERHLHVLRRSHNAVIPACQLPADVLIEIFSWTSRFSSELYWRKPWVVVSWVCQHWRDVSINCAALWTTVPLLSPEFTKLALERSKGADLSVIFTRKGRYGDVGEEVASRYSDTITKTLQKMDRVRVIDLRNPGSADRFLQNYDKTKDNAPILESLTLATRESSTNPQILSGGAFLDGRAPRLRTLELPVSHPIQWNSIPTSNVLTSLTINGTHDFRPTRLPHSEFLNGLKALTSLEYLSLFRSFPDEDPSLPPPLVQDNRITLKTLRTLIVHDTEEVLERCSNYIQLPRAESVQVVCTDPSTPSIDRILAALRGSWRGAHSNSHVIGTGTLKKFTVVNRTPNPDFDMDFDVSSVPEIPFSSANLKIRVYCRDFESLNIVQSFFERVDYSSLKELRLEDSESRFNDLWKWVGALPTLEKISLSDCTLALHGLLRVLCRDPALLALEKSGRTKDPIAQSMTIPPKMFPVWSKLKITYKRSEVFKVPLLGLARVMLRRALVLGRPLSYLMFDLSECYGSASFPLDLCMFDERAFLRADIHHNNWYSWCMPRTMPSAYDTEEETDDYLDKNVWRGDILTRPAKGYTRLRTARY